MAAVSSIVLADLFTASGFAQMASPPALPAETSPVTVIDGNAIPGTGVDNVLQLLKRLDAGFTGNGNLGTELDAGGAGESHAALRNLDTLVLLDGRRIAASPFSSTD